MLAPDLNGKHYERAPAKAVKPSAFYCDFFAYLTMVAYFCDDKESHESGRPTQFQNGNNAP